MNWDQRCPHTYRPQGVRGRFRCYLMGRYPDPKEKEDGLCFWRHFPVKLSPGCLSELQFLQSFHLGQHIGGYCSQV